MLATECFKGPIALHTLWRILSHVLEHQSITRMYLPVDALDEYGLGSLHYAAESGQLGAIRVLMKHGARVDVVDEAGKTPAELARAWGFAEAAVLLDQHQEAASIPRQEGGDGTAATQDSAPSVNKPDEARSGGPRRMQMPSNLQPEKLEL